MKKDQEGDTKKPVDAKGILVIIGGKGNKKLDVPKNKESNDDSALLDILKTFVELVGKEDPVIELITSGSKVAEDSLKDYRDFFKELGVTKIGQIDLRSQEEVLKEDLLTRVNKANGFFFLGEDPLLLTSIYQETKFLKRLKERYLCEKIVIGSTSAGAMAMFAQMITAGNNEVQELAGEIRVTAGFGLLEGVCVDTDFIGKKGFVRLAQVVASNLAIIGLGIDEDTALIVRHGEDAEVIGSGIVVVLDGSTITYTNEVEINSGAPISIKDLTVHILSKGDHYCIRGMNADNNLK